MSEFFFGILKHPFTWGVILGLGVGGALWFQTWKAKREERGRRIEAGQKLQHADETLSRVQRAGDDAHRRELGKKEAEIAALRNKIDQLKEEIHKSELKLQKEKSEGSGFLGKVRDKLIGPAKTIKPAEVIEPEVLTDSEEES